MSWPWNPCQRSLMVIEYGTIRSTHHFWDILLQKCCDLGNVFIQLRVVTNLKAVLLKDNQERFWQKILRMQHLYRRYMKKNIRVHFLEYCARTLLSCFSVAFSCMICCWAVFNSDWRPVRFCVSCSSWLLRCFTCTAAAVSPSLQHCSHFTETQTHFIPSTEWGRNG